MASDNDNSGDNKVGMTSSQPYLIRAIYEWIVDNDLTPYLMVDATKRGTVVPEDYLDEQGRIILNISPSATSGLLLTNEEVTFSARFSGQSMGIVVPTYSVRAIYARENGQGMVFEESKEPTEVKETSRKVALEAVSVSGGDENDSKPDKSDSPGPKDSGVGSGNDKPSGDKKKGGKKGPHLKVIK